MRLFSISVICIALLSTCKKEDLELTINGIVQDPNLALVLSSASIQLAAKEISGGTFNNNFNTVANTSTNSNGQFSLTFERKTVSEYRIRVSKNGYFEKEVFITGDAVQPDSPYNVSIEAIPQAFYSLRVQNTNPIDDSDRISYRNTNADLECSCCTNQTVTLIGQQIDTSYTCVHEGAKWLKYYYEVEKNGNTNSFIDSIFLTAFDTTSNHIQY